MDIHHIMVSEASDALTLVFPRPTIELVQAAIDLAVREGDKPTDDNPGGMSAGDQLALLEFADFLRHLQLRRAWQEEAMRKDGIVPMWEQTPPPLDPDPLKASKASIKVMPRRCDECLMPDPMHTIECSRR